MLNLHAVEVHNFEQQEQQILYTNYSNVSSIYIF